MTGTRPPRPVPLFALLLASLSAGVVAADDRGPVAHWKLAGDAKDSSANRLDADQPRREVHGEGAGRQDARRRVRRDRQPARGEAGARPAARHRRLHRRPVGPHPRIARRRPGRPRHPVRREEAGRLQPVAAQQHRRDHLPGQHAPAPVRHRRRQRAEVDRRGPARQRDPRLRPGGPRRPPLRRHRQQRARTTSAASTATTAPGKWADCGAPDKCNAISALAVHQGKLYAASSKYRFAGSALPESKNANPGGGRLPLRGRASAGPRSAGCPTPRRSAGWSSTRAGCTPRRCTSRPASSATRPTASGPRSPVPDGKRVESLGVFNGYLWATSYDGGRVYRYDGDGVEGLRPTRRQHADLLVRRPPRPAVRRHLAERQGVPPERRVAGKTSAGSARNWR